LVDRNEPDFDKPKDIGETVQVNERRVGYVAMLNFERTAILSVFKNQKAASEHIVQHPSAICGALKFGTPLSGYYWRFWDDIDEEMQNMFLQNNELPESKTKEWDAWDAQFLL
jgi:hypothetical protein